MSGYHELHEPSFIAHEAEAAKIANRTGDQSTQRKFGNIILAIFNDTTQRLALIPRYRPDFEGKTTTRWGFPTLDIGNAPDLRTVIGKHFEHLNEIKRPTLYANATSIEGLGWFTRHHVIGTPKGPDVVDFAVLIRVAGEGITLDALGMDNSARLETINEALSRSETPIYDPDQEIHHTMVVRIGELANNQPA